jgi:hypothetical protein
MSPLVAIEAAITPKVTDQPPLIFLTFGGLLRLIRCFCEGLAANCFFLDGRRLVAESWGIFIGQEA